MFSSRSLTILGLTCKSLTDLELIFVSSVRQGPSFIFFSCDYPVFPTEFKETVFSPLCALGFFVKNQLTAYEWVYVLALQSVPLASVQFSSVAQSCPTLCDPMNHSMPGLPVHHQLLESTQHMSIESVMPSNHLILCHSLLLLPPILPSIRVFSNESTLHMRWPKYWSFSFSSSRFNEHPGLISFRISFRMDCWLDLLAVQGTLKSLHQHHSSKASILRLSAFFIVRLSHPYMTNVPVFIPVLYCFDYCSLVIYFEIRKCDTSSFVLSQDFFGQSGYFVVPYKFQDSFFYFCKK